MTSTLHAQPAFSDLFSKLEKADKDSSKITAYKNLITYYSQTSSDSAEYYGRKALEYAIGKKYLMGEAGIEEHLGLIDKKQGRVDIGEKRIAHALDIYKSLNYLPGIARMTNRLGAIEGGKGNYDIAIKYFFEALKLYDSLADNEGRMINYMNLGSLYMQHDDVVNAYKYLVQARDASKQMPLKDVTISLYNTIGVLEIARGDSQKGLEMFLNDLKLSDKPEFVNSRVECLSYLGQYYLDKKMPEEARKYLEEGLTVAAAHNLTELESNILLEIADVLKINDPVSALAYMRRAEVIGQNMHNKRFLIYVLEDMAALYKQQGNFKDALEVTEQKQKVADSVFSIDKEKEIASIGSDYEFERSKIRVNQLQVISQKNERERNALVVIAISIIIILFVLLFYYRKSTILNKQLVLRKEELKALNAMKDKLFSVIGHDLRGSVATIPGILEVYEDESTNDDEKKFILDSLKEHSKVSLETLDKLLYWGQLLVKGTRIRKINFYSKGYIRETLEFKKMAAAEKQIKIIDNTPADIQLYADPTHFDFIIRNLLANAIKYTYEHGRVDITAESASRQGFVVFALKDNGVGMDKELLSKLFAPVSSAAGTANERGNGIGLMLCREFAIQNGGDIWVESEPGKGSTFYFSVKRAE